MCNGLRRKHGAAALVLLRERINTTARLLNALIARLTESR
jgi:hypothetical protein